MGGRVGIDREKERRWEEKKSLPHSGSHQHPQCGSSNNHVLKKSSFFSFSLPPFYCTCARYSIGICVSKAERRGEELGRGGDQWKSFL